MNPLDIIRYGQLTLLGALSSIPESDRLTTGACGVWSVKDIVAHMASYESYLEGVLAGFVSNGASTAAFEAMKQDPAGFNDAQVAERASHSYDEVLHELGVIHARVLALVPQIAADVWRQTGTIPWYGADYTLDDFVVYANYGHKREHAADIEAFRRGLPMSG